MIIKDPKEQLRRNLSWRLLPQLQGENSKMFRRTRRDKTRNAFVEPVADHLQTLHRCNFVYVERYWEDYVDRMAPLKQHDAIDTKGHSGKLRSRKTPLPQEVIRDIADYAIPRSNERPAVWTDRLLYGLLAHYNDTNPEAIRGYIERRRKNKS